MVDGCHEAMMLIIVELVGRATTVDRGQWIEPDYARLTGCARVMEYGAHALRRDGWRRCVRIRGHGDHGLSEHLALPPVNDFRQNGGHASGDERGWMLGADGNAGCRHAAEKLSKWFHIEGYAERRANLTGFENIVFVCAGRMAMALFGVCFGGCAHDGQASRSFALHRVDERQI